MSDHELTQTGEIVTCEACAFRAILTNRGPFVREQGDTTIDHLSAIAVDLEWRRAYVEQQLRRLQEVWRERRPIFWDLYRISRAEGWEVSVTQFGCERDDGSLTMRQARRLGQYIKAEHGL